MDFYWLGSWITISVLFFRCYLLNQMLCFSTWHVLTSSILDPCEFIRVMSSIRLPQKWETRDNTEPVQIWYYHPYRVIWSQVDSSESVRSCLALSCISSHHLWWDLTSLCYMQINTYVIGTNRRNGFFPQRKVWHLPNLQKGQKLS